MKKGFQDWLFDRVVEATADAGAVAGEFDQARQEVEALIDTKFKEIIGRLQKSFGSVTKIDSNTREKMAQTLLAVAARLRRVGQPEQPNAPIVRPGDISKSIQDNVNYVAKKLHEVEMMGSDPTVQLQGVGAYLTQSKAEIMRGVDRIFQSLKADMVNKGLSDLGGRVGEIGGRLDDLHKRISSPPLSKEERGNVYYGLAELGRATALRKRTGLRDRLDGGVKIFAGPRSTLAFDPRDPGQINQAIQKLEDPRNVRVVIDGKPYMVNLTDESDVARLMDVIQSRQAVEPPSPTQEMDPLKLARKPREKGGRPNIRINQDRMAPPGGESEPVM